MYSKMSGLPVAPLHCDIYSRDAQLISHRKSTISWTKSTTRLKMPVVPRLPLASFLPSANALPKFIDGGIGFHGIKEWFEHPKENSQETHSLRKRPLRLTISALFCDALERAITHAFHGSSKPTNYYMLGNYAPVDEFAPEPVHSVLGYLPECLNGVFLRAGPNPRFQPVAKYHWFDGDGMVHAVRIKDGKVTYASRYVRTSKLKQEEHWGSPMFWKYTVRLIESFNSSWFWALPSSIGMWTLHRSLIGDLSGSKGLVWLALFKLREVLGLVHLSNGFGTANTGLTFHNGTLFALNESDNPYILHIHEDGDLETIGRYDYDQTLDHPFSAHPKIDPDTGEMFTFGYPMDAHPYITYRVISKDGVILNSIPVTASGPIMMHDFVVSENYAIFLDCPLYFTPEDMVKKNRDPFSFDPTKPARFGVLPRYTEMEYEIRWFDFSSCMIYHTANAWEEGDEVVVIASRSPLLNMQYLVVYEKENAEALVHNLWEYRLNLRTGEAKERKLGELVSEFPRINEEYGGRKNRYVYTAIFEDATRLIGIAKYDLTLEPEFGKTMEVGGNVAGVFWFGNKRYGSEHVYVPKKPGREVDEDDGYLLCYIFDEITWKSELVVIDAKTMTSDPVAVIELPARVPYGFHAMFVGEDKLRLQKSRENH